jgi:hypothetical protein
LSVKKHQNHCKKASNVPIGQGFLQIILIRFSSARHIIMLLSLIFPMKEGPSVYGVDLVNQADLRFWHPFIYNDNNYES